MRLKKEEQNSIVALARLHFGESVNVYLFGSRVDDDRKGGDIDLLIEADHEVKLETQIEFLNSIRKEVTERKVDLIVQAPGRESSSIAKTAKTRGVLLC